jgi:hypothetical protein
LAYRARRQQLSFAGSCARGRRAAIISTFIETAKLDDFGGFHARRSHAGGRQARKQP